MTVASALILRVRRRCDIVGSGVLDAELLDYLNQALSELQEEILRSHGEWSHVTTATLSCTTAGAITLPGDMRRLLRLDWLYEGKRYPLHRIEPGNEVTETTGQAWYPGQVGYWVNHNALGSTPIAVTSPPPTATTSIGCTYVSTWALSVSPDLDNRWGHDELLVCRAAILFRQKEESPTQDLERELERHLQRIAARPTDDRGPPRQMPRIYEGPRRLRVVR